MSEKIHSKRAVHRQELLERLRLLLRDAQLLLPRLDEALTHPSFANETGLPHNQRLEFLGDAVLGLCVSEILTERYSDADEGKLSRIRSALINAEALAHWAREENLGLAIALGRGARNQNETGQTNVLADAVEAIVAAVYDAYGIEYAKRLVEAIVHMPLSNEAALLEMLDPKSELQERVQSKGFPSPVYRTIKADGGPREHVFTVEVLVGEKVLAQGSGKSKRLAERAAASVALASLDLPSLGSVPT
ncbi:MAG: ribonuclease III [Polyangiaceae bacterium]|nr:ribonuclease III [Polyangiaceae bacterium]